MLSIYFPIQDHLSSMGIYPTPALSCKYFTMMVALHPLEHFFSSLLYELHFLFWRFQVKLLQTVCL